MKKTHEDEEEREEEGRGVDLRWLCGGATGGCWPESCLVGGRFFFFSAYFPSILLLYFLLFSFVLLSVSSLSLFDLVLLLLFYSKGGGGDTRGRVTTGGGCCNFLLLSRVEALAFVFSVGRSSLFCLFCLLYFQCSRSQWQRCWWWNQGGHCSCTFFLSLLLLSSVPPCFPQTIPQPFLKLSFYFLLSILFSQNNFSPPLSLKSPPVFIGGQGRGSPYLVQVQGIVIVDTRCRATAPTFLFI